MITKKIVLGSANINHVYGLNKNEIKGKKFLELMNYVYQKGVKIIERKIHPDEMKDFVGCFLTGTAAEVTPVSQIGKFKFEVCSLIKDLSKSYQNLVRKKTAA